MRKKSYKIIIIILIMIIFIIGKNMLNTKTKEIIEYTPQQEITEEQERQTIVTLYFINKDTQELIPEARQIDVKQLNQNPYRTILELLLSGPKNNKLESIIPQGTVINNISVKGDIVYIDLSNEFIENQVDDIIKQNLAIQSITNTLTELIEINGIKILINGQEKVEFKNNGLNLNQIFKRNE